MYLTKGFYKVSTAELVKKTFGKKNGLKADRRTVSIFKIKIGRRRISGTGSVVILSCDMSIDKKSE